MMRILRAAQAATIGAVLLVAGEATRGQTPFTSSFTTGSNWNTIYAQGFSPMENASPDPGLSPTDLVALDAFQFYKSGNVDSAANIQLAIVSNYFLNLDELTTLSTELVGLSTNTIASTASIAMGDPIAFQFSSIELTFGDDYAAIFVTRSGDSLIPVQVSAMIADYAETSPGSGVWAPTADYGDPEIDYFKSVSNFLSSNEFGTYLVTFNPPYADAVFVASFNQPGAPLAGDYDDNGTVDGGDLTVWNGQYGQTGASLAADGNGDEIVDGADYLLWQRHFGQGGPAVVAAAAVPEPASFALAVLLGGGLAAIARTSSLG
ncbi:MAG: hypothetical protein KF688_06275 [Pirellulales bacterium]|nr:hypothetical protein [Pirellulales bacterium]